MISGANSVAMILINQQIQIRIQIERKNISQVEKAKSLGVFIDDKLTWKNHVDKISKKISSGIGALKRLKPFVSLDTAKKIYDSLIQPHFDCCCTVWDGINNQSTEKLQKLQNRAAKMVLLAMKLVHLLFWTRLGGKVDFQPTKAQGHHGFQVFT